MSKAKIFILAWTSILVVSASSFYAYIAYFNKPKVGKLNLFATEAQENLKGDAKGEGWFGMLSGSKDLYPAKEVDLHIDLGETEKNFLITIDKLSQNSLLNLEENLKIFGIPYSVLNDTNGFKVEIDSPTKVKMQARLEIIKTFNLSKNH